MYFVFLYLHIVLASTFRLQIYNLLFIPKQNQKEKVKRD